ncbi:hypothetical protein MNBD_GAMMA03-777 [hydrothermal vent metagenome]|uniref:Peptidase M48 domain-containing protein n=1 Tax=hydrothermal vent metagenome TaxID=652676 RepID=A0A3B0W4F9_9ZZZZ
MMLLVVLTLASTIRAAEPPDLGSSDLIAYNINVEQELGRAFNTALHTQYDLNYDPDVVTYIRKIGHEIASQTGTPRAFRFYVIDNPSINAFAGPNGIVGIHTGLILAVQSEDELAAVIAHEIAHVTQNHLSRGHEINQKQGSLSTIATLLAAILIGMHDSTAIYPTLIAGMSLNIERQLKNSRLYESEADHIGIKFLNQSGYNPHAMSRFFERLAKKNQYNTFQIPEILRSHPVTERRIEEAENRAQNLTAQYVKKSNNHLSLIQLKLKNDLKNQIINDTTLSLTPGESCYQQNLQTLSKNSPPPLSQLRCLQEMEKQHPHQFLYTTLLLNTVTKHPLTPAFTAQIISQAEYLLALNPNNTALLLSYTKLLLSLNKKQQAITLLMQHTDQQRYTYQIYKTLSEIYASQQKQTEAYYFLALAQFDIGNIKRTLYLLKQAKITANATLKQHIALFEHKNKNLLKNKKYKE